MTKKKRPPRYDWEAIGRDWRAGVLSHADIARKYGMDEANLRRKAKAQGWKKDLQETIRSRALITLRSLEDDRAHDRSNSQGDSAQADRAEQATEDVVNDAVQTQLGVILGSRKRIREGLGLVDRLMSELDGQTLHQGKLEELIEWLYSNGSPADNLARAALKQALSLGNRVTTMVNLANAMARLTALQRQAFGLEDKAVRDPVMVDAQKAATMDGRTDADRAAALLNMIERANRAKQTNEGTETKQ